MWQHHRHRRGDSAHPDGELLQHPLFPSAAREPNMVNLPVMTHADMDDCRELVDMMWMPRLEAFRPDDLHQRRLMHTATTCWAK
jgi:hypothetical protein